MGYRSDVGIVISGHPRPYDALSNTISLLVPHFEDFEGYNIFDIVIRPDAPGSTKRDYLYYAIGVKWYDTYGIVEAVTNFLDLLEPDDYRCVIVGEELEDIRSEGSFYGNEYDLDVTRGIYMNV